MQDINWDKYRNTQEEIDLQAVYWDVCTASGSSITEEGITYITAVQNLQRIVSRQVAAVIIVTAIGFGCE